LEVTICQTRWISNKVKHREKCYKFCTKIFLQFLLYVKILCAKVYYTRMLKDNPNLNYIVFHTSFTEYIKQHCVNAVMQCTVPYTQRQVWHCVSHVAAIRFFLRCDNFYNCTVFNSRFSRCQACLGGGGTHFQHIL